jgi:hypothetical protein
LVRDILSSIAAGLIPLGPERMAIDIGRRKFIAGLGGTAAAWPLSARAQQSAMPVIGFLGSSSKADTQQYISDFLQGMRGFGYVEERSYEMQQRYAEGDLSRLPLLVQELLRFQPQVIVADSTPGTLAAKKATCRDISRRRNQRRQRQGWSARPGSDAEGRPKAPF